MICVVRMYSCAKAERMVFVRELSARPPCAGLRCLLKVLARDSVIYFLIYHHNSKPQLGVCRFLLELLLNECDLQIFLSAGRRSRDLDVEYRQYYGKNCPNRGKTLRTCKFRLIGFLCSCQLISGRPFLRLFILVVTALALASGSQHFAEGQSHQHRVCNVV